MRPSGGGGDGASSGSGGAGADAIVATVRKTAELERRSAELLERINECDGAAALEVEEMSRIRSAAGEAKRAAGEESGSGAEPGARVQLALLEVQSAAVAAKMRLAGAKGALCRDKASSLERHIETIMATDLGDGMGGGDAVGNSVRSVLPLKGRLVLAEMSLLEQAAELEQLKTAQIAQIERLRQDVAAARSEIDQSEARAAQLRAAITQRERSGERGGAAGARAALGAARAEVSPPPSARRVGESYAKLWTANFDDGSGLYYYYCEATGVSTWVRPEGAGDIVVDAAK